MKSINKPNFSVGSESLETLQLYLKNSSYSNIIILTDENSHKFCYPLISRYLGQHMSIIMKSGEENKNLTTCTDVWNELAKNNIDRNALIINLGGGVVCDMGGFIASMYKRGIDFVHVPTTLLSMCDACIGGKLGVNLEGLKNYIGLFRNPAAVFIYHNFLKTLPHKHIISGYAEFIKHALIADKRFFNEICELDDFADDFEKLISRSIRIKSRIVNLDAFEKGIRKSLNFGHSIGHGIESFHILHLPQFDISHGEAVAAGMIAESYISYRKKFLTEKELNQVVLLIHKFFKKIQMQDKDIPEITELVNKDKKNDVSDKIFSLIDGIGQFRVNEKVSDAEIIESLKFYKDM